MKCPKCGYVRQSRDNVFAPPTECPACGVVYAKYLTSEVSPAMSPREAGNGSKRSSPVHEDTLKKARDRVERRLRKKLDPQEKDELREQTLQRARQFVSEGIKKRREEMQHLNSENPDDAQLQDGVATEKDAVEDGPFTPSSGSSLEEQWADQQAEEVQAPYPAEAEANHVDTPGEDAAPEMSAASEGETDDQVSISTAQSPVEDAVNEDQLSPFSESSLEHWAEQQAEKVQAPYLTEAEANHVDTPGEHSPSEMSEGLEDEIDETAAAQSDAAGIEAQVDQAAQSSLEASAEAQAYAQIFTIGEAAEVAPKQDQHRFASNPSEDEISEQSAAALNSAAMLSAAAVTAERGVASNGGSGLMRLLPAAAWMILVAGVIGAVLSWTTLGDVQAGINAGDLSVSGDNRLPIALLLGFAYLATGVLGFAFFWVSSMINSQIREIRSLLLKSKLLKSASSD